MNSVKELQEKSKFARPEFFVFLSEDSSTAQTESECIENAALNTAIKVKNAGNSLFQSKKYDEAIALYTKAIAKLQGMNDKISTQQLAICYQNRGASYEQKKQFDKAAADATKAIELNEVYAKAYFRRAKAFIGQKKLYSALQDIVQACILNKFRNKSYNKIATDINSQFESDTFEDHAGNAFKELDYKEQDCDHCRLERLKVMKKSGILEPITVHFPSDHPNNGYARAMQGLNDLKDTEIMIGCEEEVSARGKFDAHSNILLAFMNAIVFPLTTLKTKLVDLEQMSSIVSRQDTPAEILFGAKLCIANIYNTVGKFEGANRILDSLETDYPDNGLIYLIKCGTLTSQSITFRELYDSLCRCCVLLPNFYEVHFQRVIADFQHDRGNIRLADSRIKKQLKVLIAQFPKELTPRLVLAHKYLVERQFRKAEKLIKGAEKDFTDPVELDKLSCMRGRLNPMHPSSVEYFKCAIKINTEDGPAHQGLFNYYVLKSHEYAKALEVANRAMLHCLETSIYKEMFMSRQTLLTKIAAQNFWDQL